MKKTGLITLIFFTVFFNIHAKGQQKSSAEYPDEAINLVIPYAAGGSADLESRLISDLVSEKIGQPINLIFKPGGANIPGTMEVVNGKTDGYTLFWWATPVIAINPYIRETPYTSDDLQPIISIIDNPIMLFVRSNSEITNLDEFLAKMRSDDMTVGINVIGSVPFMAAAQLAEAGGVEFKYITQKTNPAAAVALMGGHVDCAFGTGPQLAAYPDDLKAIAVFSTERNERFPDVATALEQGFDILAPVQSGIAVKKGTPQEIVEFLENAYFEVLSGSEYQKAALARGMFVAPASLWGRQATEKSWDKSIEVYSAIIEKNNLKK